MARKRQLVLFRPNESEGPATGHASMGSEGEFIASVAPFNTAPDGSPPRSVGTQVLHGPGLIIEYADNQDQIAQAMLTVIDEEIAWPVLRRLCRTLNWKMQDIESGQVFG